MGGPRDYHTVLSEVRQTKTNIMISLICEILKNDTNGEAGDVKIEVGVTQPLPGRGPQNAECEHHLEAGKAGHHARDPHLTVPHYLPFGSSILGLTWWQNI